MNPSDLLAALVRGMSAAGPALVFSGTVALDLPGPFDPCVKVSGRVAVGLDGAPVLKDFAVEHVGFSEQAVAGPPVDNVVRGPGGHVIPFPDKR